MTRTTKLMRVPKDFHTTIEKISKKEGLSMTKFLEKDGVRIFKNADALTNLLGFGRKKK